MDGGEEGNWKGGLGGCGGVIEGGLILFSCRTIPL